MKIVCICGVEYDLSDPEAFALHDDHDYPDDAMLPTEFDLVDPRYWEALGSVMGGWPRKE